MGARTLLVIIAFFIANGFTCGDLDDLAPGEPICPAQCPAGYSPVDFCPAFTDCVDVDHCSDLLTCAPDLNAEAGLDQPYGDADLDCDQRLRCPDGTIKVSHCPEDQLCTRIARCDESILCLESDLLCQQEPLCPDGDRPLPGCDDDGQCYRHHHCSGPVDCLRCDEHLPQGCEEDELPIDPQFCGELFPCRQVETCEATHHCAAMQSCQAFADCPPGSHEVESCDGDAPYPHCFELATCQGPMRCEGSELHCNADPVCPQDYIEIDLQDCLDDQQICHLVVKCGVAIGCLPAG